MVNIVLDAFDADITLSEMALLKGKIFLLKGIDACAVFEMSVSLIRSMFLYQTNAEFNLSTLKYFIHTNPDFFFNPANAQLNNPKAFGAIASADANGLYSSDTMVLKYDFIRYLSLKLFNTINGVDLFVNIDDLLEDISNKLNQVMKKNMDILKYNDMIYGTNPNLLSNPYKTKIYDHNTNTYVDVYAKYETDTAEKNICRELLLQLLKLDSGRFNDVLNTASPQGLPFEAGDSINFKITINPAKNQCLLTGVQPILGRTYQIKIVLTDEVISVMPISILNHVVKPKKRIATGYNPKHRPTIVFRSIHDLPIDYYDFVLFRFNIYIRDPPISNHTHHENHIDNHDNHDNHENHSDNHHHDNHHNHHHHTHPNPNPNPPNNSPYRFTSGMLQIYPKAFNGINKISNSNRFEFNNEIENISTYENLASHGIYGRMFYIPYSIDCESNLYVHIRNDGCFEFELPENSSIEIELINPGKLPYEAISTKFFDINII